MSYDGIGKKTSKKSMEAQLTVDIIVINTLNHTQSNIIK